MPVDLRISEITFGWEKREWEGVHSTVLVTWEVCLSPASLLIPALFCTAKGQRLEDGGSPGLLSVSFQLSLASGSHGGGSWGV